MDTRICWIVSLTIAACFFICMQQSRRAAMALRRLLVAAPGGTAHPDIYPRKCMHRYGLHPGPLASSYEYQFVSPLANPVEAAFCAVKKTYNK
jgi:hypothetical protein